MKINFRRFWVTMSKQCLNILPFYSPAPSDELQSYDGTTNAELLIGNSDLLTHKEKHMFTEHMLDRYVFQVFKTDGQGFRNIKTFLSKIVVKWVIFI